MCVCLLWILLTASGPVVWSLVLPLLQTSTQLEKVRSNQKRKFAALQSSLQQRLTEAEQKLAKLSTKKNVGQGMGQMLKQFVAAATD